MSDRLRRLVPVIAGIVLFALALEVLRVELHAVSWRQLVADVGAMPAHRLLLAVLLTAVNYAVLTGYDFVAFSYVGQSLAPHRIVAASFLSYAVSNNVGFAALSGASVRYRFYTRWGVSAEDLSRIVFSYSVTFWLGLLALGGLSLATASERVLAPAGASRIAVPVGWLLIAVALGYVAVSGVRRAPIRMWSFELPMPSLRIAATQLTLSSIDWALAAGVLYVLLPPSDLTFLTFLGAFLGAMLLGMVSHVPGGVGVFEGLLVLSLKPFLASSALLPSLLVYRAVYYLLPFVAALVGLICDELMQRRASVQAFTAMVGRLTEQVTPRLFALLTFLSGVVLLLSGATPAAPGRLERLEGWLPLGVIEASHFTASVVGAVLLLVSQGLSRRLDAAYYLASGAIAVGIVASLLKGLDYEEAALLTLVVVMLLRARPAFDRRAAFFETRFSPLWIATVVGAVGASVWLGLFAFKHVDYSGELWWRFALRGEASRFLRASVGAAVVVLLFGVARLVRPAPHEIDEPSDDDLRDAERAIAQQSSAVANLALLRDKGLLFSEDRAGFVMYGVQGRTWVAFGDPIGPEDHIAGLVRTFLERCDDFGGVPVFYEVSRQHLHRYADFGLTFVKIGEEARVDLSAFTLQGPSGSRYRQSIRRLERDGGTFAIVPQAEVRGIMPALRSVSDNWLASRAGSEKGFSLGFFDEDYLARFATATITYKGSIVAFANIWQSHDRSELSVDLMRFHENAPRSVMEALFAHLLVWGQSEGFQWFILGMAPLSGFEPSPVASLWTRLGAFLYRHGESVYHFQGLRAYKEKFDPVWEPHYLVYPGGMRLPRILADISALVAGGYRRMLLGARS